MANATRGWAVLFVMGSAVACGAQEPVGESSQALGVADERLTPSNLPADTCDAPGTKDLIDATGTVDTDTGCDAVIVQGDGAPDICVYKYRTVTLSGGGLRGVGSRALAIVATDTMTIGGFLDVGAHATVKGPGASDPRGFPLFSDADAPGGSYGTPGGLGALGSAQPAPPYGNDTAVPLLAGASGGPGYVDPSQYPSLPGEGGGALQLVSCTSLVVTSTGVIASGGGGAARTVFHGAGGGSGGTILLEAPSVVVDGILGANGGGGGGGECPRDPSPPQDAHGYDGTPTAGGWGGALNFLGGGIGGNGGSEASPPEPGQPGMTRPGGNKCGNSGGGGAAGRVRINVQAGTQPALSGAKSLSPAPSIGAIATH